MELNVKESLVMDEVKNDKDMVVATNEVLSVIQEYKNKDLTDEDLKKFMKLQKLVSEYQSNAD